jgi:hypothetical protein
MCQLDGLTQGRLANGTWSASISTVDFMQLMRVPFHSQKYVLMLFPSLKTTVSVI